ncbi:MAG: thiosulfate dehydrogenase (quinone) large subunit [Pseudonocardiales bacterium]|nr:thiosulfate dehydrogenase (quinone) large subunit [Pseudonocardiales bacterium]
MRRGKARTRLADEPAGRPDPAVTGPYATSRWRANGWPVVPLRLFLAALFGFAGYAKFSYPRFFDPASPNGFKAAVDAARHNTPIGGLMGPLADHASFFGHLTAVAEIAIGLGLLVGLLTRLAALGGMALTTMIVLSINWGGVKEYTGSSGWFTSAELAIAAALSVFLLGGAGPFALDNLFVRARERQRARDDAEPGFRDSEYEDSRRRLQGEPAPVPAGEAAAATTQLPATGYREGAGREDVRRDDSRIDARRDDAHTDARTDLRTDDTRTGNPTDDTRTDTRRDEFRRDDRDELRREEARNSPGTATPAGTPNTAGYRTVQQDEEYRDDPEPEPNSLWTQGRRTPDQPPTEPRRDG